MKHAALRARASAATRFGHLPGGSAEPTATSQQQPTPRRRSRNSLMRGSLAVAAIALVGAAGGAATAAADPVQPAKTFQFALTCTGIGDVLATNIGQSNTEAFQVVGTNTVILLGLTGQFGIVSAPGIVTQALAAGTTCTLTAAGPPGALEPVEPPVTFPVVIING
jgi:hypothetical protein